MALLNAHFDTAKYLLEARRERRTVGLVGPQAAVLGRRLQHDAARRPARPAFARRDDEPRDDRMLLEAGANPNMQLKLLPPYRSFAHGSRLRQDARHRHDAAVACRARCRPRGDRAARRRRRAARSAAARRHHAADGPPSGRARDSIDSAASSAPSSKRSRRPTRCSRRALPSTNATARGRTALHYAAAVGYTDVARELVEQAPISQRRTPIGVTPIDAANGKLRAAAGSARAAQHIPRRSRRSRNRWPSRISDRLITIDFSREVLTSAQRRHVTRARAQLGARTASTQNSGSLRCTSCWRACSARAPGFVAPHVPGTARDSVGPRARAG